MTPIQRHRRPVFGEPAADLAMIIALASSFRDKTVPSDLVAVGEVGLTGELRPVNALGQRLSEVHRLGFIQMPGPLPDHWPSA